MFSTGKTGELYYNRQRSSEEVGAILHMDKGSKMEQSFSKGSQLPRKLQCAEPVSLPLYL